MDASYVATNFQGGEWSQAMQGRLDDQRYRTALNVCQNGFPIEEGAWVRRPGSMMVTQLKGPGRVLPIAIQNTAPYTMIFSDNLLQFLNGTTLLTQQVTTPFVEGNANNSDWQNLRVVQAETTAALLTGGVPQELTIETPPSGNAPATFSGLSAINFQDGPYLDIPTDSTTATLSGASGVITVTLSGPGTTVFSATDVGRLVRLLGQPPNWNPGTTYNTGGQQVYYEGNVYYLLLLAVGGQAIVGVPPPSNPPLAPAAGGSNGGWILTPNGAIWTWGIITAVNSPSSATVSIQGPALQFHSPTQFFRLGVFSNTTGWPTCGCYHEGRLWLAGAKANRVDASMTTVPQPDPSYGAQVNASTPPIFVFSPTDIFGNVTDANGISATFLADDDNTIVWMEPDQQGILCGTRAGEWLIQATAVNAPLTPTSIQAHRYTTIECANVAPARTNLTLTFVQLFQRKVIEYFADVFSGRLQGPNLSETAKHLMVNFIKEIAFQKETNPVIWARDGAGALIGCSYKRENLFSREKPTFAGWHRQPLGSGRQVTSICTAGNASGNLDALFFVSHDPVASNYWVEILGDLPDENISTLTSFNYLDASTLVTNYVDNGPAVGTLTLNGLSYLAGKTVTVWAGGLDVGDYTVSNTGTITVEYGDGINSGPNGTSDQTGTTNPGGGAYLFTSAYVQSFGLDQMPIYVGYTYASQGQLVRPQSSQEAGARNGPGFAKKRRNHEYGIQVVNSQGLSVGTDFTASEQMFPAAFKDKTETILPPNQLFSGIHWDVCGDDETFDGMLAWQVTRPYPATVSIVGGFIHTEDK